MNLTDQKTQRLLTGINFLLVGAMLTCFALSIIQVGELVMTGWRGAYLAWLAFFVALEAAYSQCRLSGTGSTEPEFVLYRLAEWIVIMSLLKAAHYLTAGFQLLRLDLPLWQEDFLRYFFSAEYLFGLFLLFVTWSVAGIFASHLQALEATENSLRAEVESGIYDPRPQAREALVNLFLGLGIIMVFLAAALRMDLVARWFDMPAMRSGVYNLLLYFLLGLVLLSLSQYSLLRVSWMLERLPIQREIPTRWAIYSFIFILLITLIASWLPTSYSIGLLSVLKFFSMMVMSILAVLPALIIFPFILLINFLMSLLRPQSEPLASPSLEFPSFEPPPVSDQLPLPWLELIKSVLFWAVFLAVIAFALYYYLHEHGELLAALRRLPVFSSLARFWTWLRQQVGWLNQQVSTSLDQNLQRLKARFSRKPLQETWNFLHLRSLTQRGQVLFCYLALLRRCAESGIPRQPAQTPFEYSQHLLAMLQSQPSEHSSAELARELDDFTAHFVEARYSLHPVTGEDVGLVRRYWSHLRRLLRRLRPASPSE